MPTKNDDDSGIFNLPKAEEEIGDGAVWFPQDGPQADAIQATWCTELLYGGARGGGKGLRPHERVQTPLGGLPISALKVGDEVAHPSGKATKVIGVYPRSEQVFYKIQFCDGSHIECDEDHIWKVRYSDKNGVLGRWQLITTKLLVERFPTHEGKTFIPAIKPVQHTLSLRVHANIKIKPYLMGVLLGCKLLRSDLLRLNVSQELCDSIERHLPEGDTLKRHSWGGEIVGGATRQALIDLGINDLLVQDKYVPYVYEMGSIADRRDLLAGFLDAGATFIDNAVYFLTKCEKIAVCAQRIAWSLGIYSRISGRDHDGMIKTYNVSLVHGERDLPFKLATKKTLYNRLPNTAFRTKERQITAITKAKAGKSVCIKVSHPDGMFVAGKSYVATHNTDYLLGDWLQDVDKYGEAWQGIFIRRTYDDLRHAIKRSQQVFGATGDCMYKVTAKEWQWENGATLRFVYLDSSQDASRFQGHEFVWIAFDEIGQWSDDAGYLMLTACLRSSHDVPTKRIRATANPGGPGHHWVKARFIDYAPDGYKPFDDPETNITRMFIPSKVSDNKILLEKDPDYADRLKGVGSPELVRAWLEGDWTAITGAYFSEFSTKRHVRRPFKIPPHWLKFRAFDWGSAAPFACLWFAVSDGTIEGLGKGTLVVYREWYGASGPNKGLRMRQEDVARGIIEREERGEIITYSVADPAMFKEEGGPSIAEVFYREGVNFRRADNARIVGWNNIRSRLIGDDDGYPGLVFFSTCTNCIRTVPALQHDLKKQEDIDTTGDDHCFAAGTLVATIDGDIPIEQLTEGYVKSRHGDYTYFFNGRRTREAADVVKVTYSDGTCVVCTPDHQFLTRDGWVKAVNLSGTISSENRTWTPQLLQKAYKSLTACVITNAASTSADKRSVKRGARGYIGLCGNIITGQFLKAWKSTIKTITETIIALTILNYSLRLHTANTTASYAVGQSLVRERERRPQNGIGAKPGERGIGSMSGKIAGNSWITFLLRTSKKSASNAASLTIPLSLRRVLASIVTRIAKQKRCVSVERLKEKQDVYCITVPRDEAFTLSIGVVVHNCGDSLRYGCMSRPYTKRAENIASSQAIKVVKPTLNDVIRANNKVSKPTYNLI